MLSETQAVIEGYGRPAQGEPDQFTKDSECIVL